MFGNPLVVGMRGFLYISIRLFKNNIMPDYKKKKVSSRDMKAESKRKTTAKVNAQSNLRERQTDKARKIRTSDDAMKKRRANFDKYGY